MTHQPKAGMDLLLAALRDDPTPPQTSEVAFAAAFSLAERQGVLPTFTGYLRNRAMPIPPACAGLLANAERGIAQSAFWWTAELTGLLRAFASADLRALPLKGPSLAARLYGSAALRPCRDLDLLVPAADLPRAEALLRTLGFHPALPPDDYHQQWQRGTSAVELHRNLENPLAFDLQIRALWTRATLGTFNGVPAWQLAPADELTYLCLHAARHRYERLSHTLDIVRAQSQTATPINAIPIVQLGQAMAAQLTGDPVETSPHVTRLAQTLWQELLHTDPPPLDWQAQHRFFLQLEPTPLARLRRRLRHTRILLTRVIPQDTAFAARLGLYRHWQAWLLRPLRLLLRSSRP